MKITLPASQSIYHKAAPFSKTLLLVLVALLYCINSLSAAAKTSSLNKNRHIIRSANNGEPVVAAHQITGLPVVSYSTPKTYMVGTAITALAPVSNAVDAPGYNAPISIGSGFSIPRTAAVDLNGNVYVADETKTSIIMIPAGNGAPATVGTGFNDPKSVAVDLSGNIFVADYGNNAVKKVSVLGGAPVAWGSGYVNPVAISTDPAGNVYVAQGNGEVIKLTTLGNQSVVVTNAGGITSVAADATGNIYFNNGNTIYKVPAGTSTQVSIGSGFSDPSGLSVDAAGNVYVADYLNNAIKLIPAGGGSTVAIASGVNKPTGVAVGPTGVVYWGDYNDHLVKQMTPSGGYYLNTALPAGLNFNGTTGVISGMPTAAMHIANYMVTAYNSNGSTSTYLNMQVRSVPPATLSYSLPQPYVINNAISPLVPASSGVSAPGYNNTPFIFSYSFKYPTNVATDAAGNIYISDPYHNTITKLPINGGPAVALGTGFNGPIGIAVDAAGNVYVADTGHNIIEMIPVGGGAIVTLSTGFNYPSYIALDAANNIYVSDENNNVVKKIPAGGGTAVTIASGFSHPTGIAVDVAGNIYVADNINNVIKKIPAGGSTATVYATGFSQPMGVAIDASGNLFVADYVNKLIKEVPAGGGTPVVIGSGFNLPQGLAVDASGNLFIADSFNSAIKEVTPSGGFYLANPLPAGLTLNKTTGTISGTPTANRPAKNYTITAYNNDGGTPATANLQVRSLAPVTVSYSSPQTYTIGAAIASLSPTSNGVGPASFSTSPLTLSSALNQPVGLTIDGTGNIFIADRGTNSIQKIPAGGGSLVTVATGFNVPYAVVVDAAGNLYVADGNNSAVKKIPAGGGAPITLGSGFNTPTGLAVDAAGNVFVADQGNSLVKEIPIAGGAPVTLGSGFDHPFGVAVDAAGNIYVADYNNNAIKKMPPGGGTPVTIATGFEGPTSLSVDAEGNIFAVDFGHNQVKEIPAGSASPIILSSSFSSPEGVALDGAENIYIADRDNHSVKEISPVGGYFLNKALPAGLSISVQSGTISGTPTAASPATNYTVTAYNSGGGTPAIVNIKTQPITIGYPTPNIFNVGTAISPLSPSGVGVSSFAYNSAATNFVPNIAHPTGIATDVAGNVYIADQTANKVYKVLAGTTTPVAIGTGFLQPYAVAVDAVGNVYVADFGDGKAEKILAGTNTTVVLATGFSLATGIAVDVAGNVYVADLSNSSVKKIPVGGGAPVLVGSGWVSPYGVAVDLAGNLYVSENYAASIKMLPAGSSTPIALGSGFSRPQGLAVDPGGNVFVTDNAKGQVFMIPAGNGTPVIIGPGFSGVFGAAVGPSGKVYVADYYTTTVKYVQPTGGYFLNTFLPPGLNFSNATGNISGTPAALSPATDYTVTAYSGNASTTATVNIQVNAASTANLANLVLSSGTLTPVFSSGTITYTAAVSNTTTGIKVTPTVATTGATVKVNGTAVTSGSASATLPLSLGANTITTVVSGSGGATKTYTVTVTRANGGSGNAVLSKIATNSGISLTQVTGADYRDYTLSVPGTLTSIQITPTTQDPTATVKVNGVTVASGTASASIPLAVGNTVINTVVTAQDGVTIKTYGITVTRAATLSNNAVLSKIATNSGLALTQVTGTDYRDYTISVPNATATITVTPTTQDATATVKVNGVTVASGTASANIPLAVGSTVINTMVTAQDGVTVKTYGITVTRAASGSSNAVLSKIATNSGVALTQVTGTDYRDYTISVPNTTSTITVTPTTQDATATVKVNGVTVASGTASVSIALAVGNTVINTVVTAQDGVTKNTYGITVTRAASALSSNALLSKIATNSGVALTQVTGTDYRDYTIAVPNTTSTITVTPTVQDATATVKVNGVTVASGTASASISLAVGNTVIKTVITAQDGVTVKTYGITVTRAAMMALYVPADSLITTNVNNVDDGILVHQGITPNGDGINDVFTIDGINAYPGNHVMIMGRSGNVVYEAKGYDNQTKFFDGHSGKNGTMLLPGTYFYSLEYTVNGKTRLKTGFIVLKY